MSARIHSIDSLRAGAMTMVIAQHCGLMPFGWTGVWLFYNISGFVISKNLLAEKSTYNSDLIGHYLSFATRRVFRIIPPYAIYIAACLATIWLLGLPEQYHDLFYLGTFTYNWRMILDTSPQFPAFGHLWTISVEEQFYLVFPMLILSIKRRRALIGLLTIIVGAPLLRILMSELMASAYWDPARVAFGVYASSFPQFDAFALGALLAHFEVPIRRNSKIAVKVAGLAISIAVLYMAAYMIINVLDGAKGVNVVRNIISGILYGEKREVFVYSAIDLWAVAVLCGAIARWRLFQLIEHPILVSIGQASYGGYLIHALVLFAIGEVIGAYPGEEPLLIRLGLFALVWICTVVIAQISYLTYERRIIRIGHKISERILSRSRKKVSITL